MKANRHRKNNNKDDERKDEKNTFLLLRKISFQKYEEMNENYCETHDHR